MNDKTELTECTNKFMNIHTGCPKKNSPVAFLLISPIKLHLLGFSRTVLKSAGSQDSKTVPENSNWSILSQENSRNRHQGLLLARIFSGQISEIFFQEVTPGVYFFNFLGIKLINLSFQGQFWNPEILEISKLSLKSPKGEIL